MGLIKIEFTDEEMHYLRLILKTFPRELADKIFLPLKRDSSERFDVRNISDVEYSILDKIYSAEKRPHNG